LLAQLVCHAAYSGRTTDRPRGYGADMTDGSFNPLVLPDDLPRPADDGAADHLPGMAMPPLALPATSGAALRVDRVPDGFQRLVIYVYPMTGRPGTALPDGWDDIPGARGCTPESCGFRDHAADIAAAGADVAGLSAQDTADQREAAERLRLPFPLLSDADGELRDALRLPSFRVDSMTLLKRLTLVLRRAADGAAVIEHVFYPVFPPDRHPDEVLGWLSSRPAG
jgi:peroxiredoxin